MTVDDLVNNLAKPIMVLRFARADTRKNSGAETRANNARKEINNLVIDYVASKYLGPSSAERSSELKK